MSLPRYTNLLTSLDLEDLEAIITSINIAFFCARVPVKDNYDGATKVLRKEIKDGKTYYSVLSNGGGHDIQTEIRTELPALALAEYNRLFSGGLHLQHTITDSSVSPTLLPYFFQANGF